MAITLKTFGRLTELTGGVQHILPAVTDTDALRQQLAQQFPELAGVRYFIAINNKMVQENTIIPENAVLALLPPFSGG